MKPIPYMPTPDELKAMTLQEMTALCGDIRGVLIDTVAENGGHLASNLGVVELTAALHRVFDFSCDKRDRLVWDVGHQCYVHKLLTGRAERFATLRRPGGLTGFPSPEESAYDAFIAGHSSTSISAANGLAKAKALRKENGFVVAVLGDGALTGGLAYEGLSNAGRSDDRLIVVLNDNRMSIGKNVGFVARHLTKLRSSSPYVRLKKGTSTLLSRIPLIGKPLYRGVAACKLKLKKALYNSSSFFEQMGFYYLGPVDGHDLRELTASLRTAKKLERPVLLHAVTVKGKGCAFAEERPDAYHGVSGFAPESGETAPAGRGFSAVAGEVLCALAKEDTRICAMTAAMKSGTGLEAFADRFPDRFFDVGIAEAHAVTFSAGLAAGGMLPVFAVYATFLQRGYDQLLNDAATDGKHIVLAVDRAGIVPEDGDTHQGLFDVPFLMTVPNVTLYTPATMEELALHLRQAIYDVPGIAVVRYPKGGELPMPKGYRSDYRPYTYLHAARAQVLLVTYGRLFANVLTAAEELIEEGVLVSVLKLSRVRPMEGACVGHALAHAHVLFFEEGMRAGGVGEWFGCRLAECGFARDYRVHAVTAYPGVCSVESGLRAAGLDVAGIKAAVLDAAGTSSAGEPSAGGEP